jgi:hypothetical protein
MVSMPFECVPVEEHYHADGPGLSIGSFLLRQAYDSVNVPQLLINGGNSTLTIHEVVKAFTNRDHGLPAQAIVITCSESPARLRQVRI